MTRRFRRAPRPRPFGAPRRTLGLFVASDRSRRDSSIGFTERFSRSSNVRRIGLMRRVESRNARATPGPAGAGQAGRSPTSRNLAHKFHETGTPRGRTDLRKDIYKRNGRLVPRPPRNCQGLLDGRRGENRKGAGDIPAPFLWNRAAGKLLLGASAGAGAAGAAGAMLSAGAAGAAGAAAGGGGGGGGSSFFAQAERPIVAASIRTNIIDRYLRMDPHSFPSEFIRIRDNATWGYSAQYSIGESGCNIFFLVSGP